MPKLPAISPKDVIKKLKKLGFVKDHQTGSHIVFYHQETDRRTVVPYHLGDIKKGTLSALLREAGIDRDEFLAA